MDKARLRTGIHRAWHLLVGVFLPLSMDTRHSHQVSRLYLVDASTLLSVSFTLVKFRLGDELRKTDATPHLGREWLNTSVDGVSVDHANVRSVSASI